MQGRSSFGYKPALDGLRAVAVGSVIAFHFGWAAAPGGFLGVDTFFVLSGYLITSLLLVEWNRTGRLDFPAFWLRRARRLLPALLLVLIAISIWTSLSVDPIRLTAIRSDGLWTLFYGANWHFVDSGQSYFDLFNEASPLRHAWSLAIEEQFYLFWPLITFACLRLGRGRTHVLTALCVAGTVASSVLLALLYRSADPSRSYFGTDTRASQLLIGALLAILLFHWEPRTARSRGLVQSAGVIAAAFCVWAFAAAHDLDSWLYFGGLPAFAVATAVVILAIVQPSGSPLTAALSWRPVRWVGQISYGLYLWHWPVAVAVSSRRTDLHGIDLALTRLALTFAFATLSYYIVELPIRRGALRGWTARLAAPVGVAVVGATILATTAGATRPPDFFTATPGSVITTPSVGAPADPLPTAPPAAATAPLPAPSEVGTILLMGDSVAQSLAPGLVRAAAERGYSANALTIPGCGGLGGRPIVPDGTEYEWGAACERETPGLQRTVVGRYDAQVVVYLDTWQITDRVVDGQHIHFGTPEGDATMLSLYEQFWSNLTASGARMLLVTVPPDVDSTTGPAKPEINASYRRLNQLMRRFAVRHPESVAIADLARVVCPQGEPCPVTMDGVVLRPYDGRHYQDGGPAWVAPRLLDLVLQTLARTS